MTTTLTDPRTELVLSAADDAECFTCDECWSPGLPMVCGAPDYGDPCIDDRCPEDCEHPTCPLCVEAWPAHERKHRPWWKRWLP